MKKTIFILLASALVMACNDKVTEIYEGNLVERLDVSSSHVVFDCDGGGKTVLVDSNLDWDCTAEGSWFSVSKGDGLIEITADANDTGAIRSASITVIGGTNGSLTETVSVGQLAAGEADDLSAEGTANCYMANTGTTYCFNATVKGNGLNANVGGIKAYVDKYGSDINPKDIIYADLLWEAVLDADLTRSCNIIDQMPVYDNGYVWFTTGYAEGNAVIAVKNAVGDILWSWHIWVTDKEIEEIEGNGHIWMDRNLGANSAEPGNIYNKGLFYQWGRKDPFLPPCSEYGASNKGEQNMQVGDGSGEWDHAGFMTKMVTEAPGNIPLSIKNPMALLIANGDVWSWYLTTYREENYASYLWGNSEDISTYVKSIFDPCPAGYNVPVANPWYSSTDSEINLWTTNENYGRYWHGGNDAYYPSPGGINGYSGAFSNVDSYGYYWTSGMDDPYESYYVDWLAMNLQNDLAARIVLSATYPVHAGSVRCMRAE